MTKHDYPTWVDDLQGLAFDSVETIPADNRMRSAEKCLVRHQGKSFLVESSNKADGKFYLQRAVTHRQDVANAFSPDFSLNELKDDQTRNGRRTVVYEKIDDLQDVTDQHPISYMTNKYAGAAEEPVTDEKVASIVSGFLSAWPPKFHKLIHTLSQFGKFVRELQQLKSVATVFEHGDFTSNNIRRQGQAYYLFDFEFCKTDQPVGFDLYDYLKSCGTLKKMSDLVPNMDLNTTKYELIMKINEVLDHSADGIVIYSTFHQEIKEAWDRLASESSVELYNLDFEWCRIWFESFGSRYTPYIVSYWQDGELTALLPLYRFRNTLRLIGTYPDLYDHADMLYRSSQGLAAVAGYLASLKLNFELKYLPTRSDFFQLVTKEIMARKVFHYTELIDINPSIEFSDFSFKKKMKDDVKRCVNNFSRDHGGDVVALFDVKDEEAISEFVGMHKSRWHGGPFETLTGLTQFVSRLYCETDLVRMDKILYGDQVGGWHLGYRNGSKSVTSAMPTYNLDLSRYSPGKVLLFRIIENQMGELQTFDFGRGPEDYKYWFCTEETTLVNIRTLRGIAFLREGIRVIKAIMRRTIG